jgi:hypothetical protein
MSSILSDELARALDEQAGSPLRTVHPVTGKVFFIVSEDRYERLKPLFEHDPLSREEQEFHLREAGRRAGWDDPAMDAYDHYDDERSKAL